jgi:hypothetical protein
MRVFTASSSMISSRVFGGLLLACKETKQSDAKKFHDFGFLPTTQSHLKVNYHGSFVCCQVLQAIFIIPAVVQKGGIIPQLVWIMIK